VGSFSIGAGRINVAEDAEAALEASFGSSVRVNQMLLSMAIVADHVDTLTPAAS